MSMNMAFEPQEPTWLEEQMLLSGGVVVMSAVVPTPDGPKPALVFRFARADGGGFHPAVLLGLENAADVPRLRELLNAALDRLEALPL
jgi:hypothetical protein